MKTERELWRARRACFSTERLANTIQVAKWGVEHGEQGVNAEHKPISAEDANGIIARSVREMHVALMNAKEFGIPLPVEVVELVKEVEKKHLDTAKAYFDEVEKSWGEGTKFGW